jgi:hypothetical protein
MKVKFLLLCGLFLLSFLVCSAQTFVCDYFSTTNFETQVSDSGTTKSSFILNKAEKTLTIQSDVVDPFTFYNLDISYKNNFGCYDIECTANAESTTPTTYLYANVHHLQGLITITIINLS